MKNGIKVTPKAPHPLPFDKRLKLVNPVLFIYLYCFGGRRNNNWEGLVMQELLNYRGITDIKDSLPLGSQSISICLWWSLQKCASQNV